MHRECVSYLLVTPGGSAFDKGQMNRMPLRLVVKNGKLSPRTPAAPRRARYLGNPSKPAIASNRGREPQGEETKRWIRQIGRA